MSSQDGGGDTKFASSPVCPGRLPTILEYDHVATWRRTCRISRRCLGRDLQRACGEACCGVASRAQLQQLALQILAAEIRNYLLANARYDTIPEDIEFGLVHCTKRYRLRDANFRAICQPCRYAMANIDLDRVQQVVRRFVACLIH